MNMLDRLDQLVHRLIEENERMKNELGQSGDGGNVSPGNMRQNEESGYSERGGGQLDLPIGSGAAEEVKIQIKERILKLISQIDDVINRENITNE